MCEGDGWAAAIRTIPRPAPNAAVIPITLLTGVDHLHALIGGLHLTGPAFEPVILLTVAALTELDPELVMPGQCTGWRAQHTLATALPEAWTPSGSGTAGRLPAPAEPRLTAEPWTSTTGLSIH